MKTTINFFSLLFVLTLIIASCNSDDDNNQCSDFCSDQNVVATTNFTQGDCMSLCNTCVNPGQSDAVKAVCLCNYVEVFLDDSGQSWSDFANSNSDFNGITNKGKCVKFFKAEIGSGNLIGF